MNTAGADPASGSLSKSTAIWIVAGITLANLALVGASSVFGVHGDGTPGSMPLVLGLGFPWVLFFTIRAILLIGAGEYQRATRTAAKAIPYAFAFIVIGGSLYFIVAITFGWL